MGAIKTLKFSESGVRGVVGESLTMQLVMELAAAFGYYIGGGRVVVGRDTRPSGEILQLAVCAGLASVGCEVVTIGVAPTPTIQIMVRHLGADGGIAISASHNDVEWNALKFISGAGVFLDRHESSELFDIYTQSSFVCKIESQLRSGYEFNHAFKVHEDRIFAAVNPALIRKCAFKVAVDAVNGVGAVFSKAFLEKLGCEVFMVNGEPTGVFGRNPEPLAEHLGALQEAVRKHGCDIGFAQDPDGDRLTVVDDRGVALNPHFTVALAVEHVLSKRPGSVVVNIQTSRILEDLAEEYDSKLFYSKVGEINVVDMMREMGAVVGGEGSCGGVIYAPVNMARDSFAGMALLLESLAERQLRLSEMMKDIPQLWQYNGKFEASPLAARTVIAALKKKYAGEKVNLLDGLRIDFPIGWVLVRPSNTESILRLQVESEAQDAMEKLRDQFRAEVEKVLHNG